MQPKNISMQRPDLTDNGAFIIACLLFMKFLGDTALEIPLITCEDIRHSGQIAATNIQYMYAYIHALVLLIGLYSQLQFSYIKP